MSQSSRRQNVSQVTATSSGSPGSLVDHDTKASSTDDELPSAGDEEFEPGKGKKTKKSTSIKRKRAERKNVQGQPPAKKARGKRGSLKDLLDMNIDVLYEIFGCLDPIDLLHLAWASKMTRGFLMSKSSKSLWKAARMNIPGIPECPEDLSEPQYVNLAFVNSCHFCLRRNISTIKIVWAARIRICGKCMDGRFLPMSRRLHYGPPHMRGLRTLVPKVMSTGRRGRQEQYFCIIKDQQWDKDFAAVENKDEWVQKEVARQEKIEAHSLECERWYHRYQKYLEEEKDALIRSRLNVVADRLRVMGWGTEIDDIRTNNSWTFDEHPLMLKACQKDLTERAIQNLLPALCGLLKHRREVRLARNLQTLLNTRIPVLKKIIDTYRSTIRPDAVALDIGDISGHPEVQDLILSLPEISDAAAHLDPIRAKLPDIAQQLQLGIEDRLVKMVEAACGTEHGLDHITLLNLATTTFQCKLCYLSVETEDIRYPRVLVHRCAIRHRVGADISKETVEYQVLATLTSQAAWNKCDPIAFNAEAHKIASDVVVRCGFDPATTSVAQMDEADPIFECHACNDPHSGRCILRWSAVPAHMRQQRRPWKVSNLRLLEGEEAQSVRIRMDEDMARKRALPTYSDMACTRCGKAGNSVSLRRHIHSEHVISNPSEAAGDFVVKLDARTIPSIFHVWPPLEEFEDTGS